MSNTNNNKIVVPEAKAAMEQFKMEAANDVDVKTHSINITRICSYNLLKLKGYL